jgi:catechol 2,3-dioxygenase-like lactoylglutathione lyase family enzyme
MVPSMLDHVSLRVRDFDRAVAFYRAALAPLGYLTVMEFPGVAGLGEPGRPDLWITKTEQDLNPTHLAFGADRAAVDAFHVAALAAGASDNGPPGVRGDYHPHYYAAFIIDPEGNNVEVVCHADPNARPARASAKPAQAKAKAKPAKQAKAKAKAKPAPKAKAKAKAAPKAKAKAKAAKPKGKRR